MREAIVTPKGKSMIHALDAAREKTVAALFADWNKGDVQNLVRLLRRFADEALAWTASR